MEKYIKYDKILNILIIKYREKIDKNNKILIILLIYFKYMSFMFYVTVLIRHIVNLLFIQRITMFTQIITMITQYFKECQPFLLTIST